MIGKPILLWSVVDSVNKILGRDILIEAIDDAFNMHQENYVSIIRSKQGKMCSRTHLVGA